MSNDLYIDVLHWEMGEPQGGQDQVLWVPPCENVLHAAREHLARAAVKCILQLPHSGDGDDFSVAEVHVVHCILL